MEAQGDARTQDTAQQADKAKMPYMSSRKLAAPKTKPHMPATPATVKAASRPATVKAAPRPSVHAMATRSQRHNPPPRPPPLVLPQSSAAPEVHSPCDSSSVDAMSTNDEEEEDEPSASQATVSTIAAPPSSTYAAPPLPSTPGDPCASLRAAAAAKGLTLSVYTGRSLPENLASEAVALAARNVSGYGGWDARQRLADLINPQTRILVLRKPSDVNAPPPLPPTLGRRASRSSSAAESPASDAAAAPAPPLTVLGFASFRFVTQETLKVVYLFELHLAEHLRRQSLGSQFLSTVDRYGRDAQRQGLLLTCHLAETARQFYVARGLEVSPVSPSRCAPPHVASQAEYDVMQSLWDEEAVATMEERGANARRVLHATNPATAKVAK